MVSRAACVSLACIAGARRTQADEDRLKLAGITGGGNVW